MLTQHKEWICGTQHPVPYESNQNLHLQLYKYVIKQKYDLLPAAKKWPQWCQHYMNTTTASAVWIPKILALMGNPTHLHQTRLVRLLHSSIPYTPLFWTPEVKANWAKPQLVLTPAPTKVTTSQADIRCRSWCLSMTLLPESLLTIYDYKAITLVLHHQHLSVSLWLATEYFGSL